jgi:hypothetical protein
MALTAIVRSHFPEATADLGMQKRRLIWAPRHRSRASVHASTHASTHAHTLTRPARSAYIAGGGEGRRHDVRSRPPPPTTTTTRRALTKVPCTRARERERERVSVSRKHARSRKQARLRAFTQASTLARLRAQRRGGCHTHRCDSDAEVVTSIHRAHRLPPAMT